MKDKFNNAVGPQVRVDKPKAGKLIPVLAVVFMLAGLQSATQFFANEFGYQPQLGAHYQHIYTPWSILIWTYKWWGHFQVSIMKAAGVGMTVTATGLLGLMVAKMVAANSAKINPYLHGSARWANQHDIERAGLLPRPITVWQQLTGKKKCSSDGVYVGAWLDKKGDHALFTAQRRGACAVLCPHSFRERGGFGHPYAVVMGTQCGHH